jgi:hypothetical protein
MKFERKQKMWIIVGIAALLLIYGLLDMIFKFNINPKTVNNVSAILMVIAFGLLFSGRKTKQDSTDNTEINNQLQNDKTQLDSFTQDTLDSTKSDSFTQDIPDSTEIADSKPNTPNDDTNTK